MAARPKVTDTAAVAKPEAVTAQTGTDWSALLAPSEGLKKVSVTRDGKPNPLAGFAAMAVGNAKMLPVPDGKVARDVTNWLRQDQLSTESLKDARLTIQYQDEKGNVLRTTKTEKDGRTVTEYPQGIRQVHYIVKPGERVQRRYGKDDIVKWFKEAKGIEISGPLTKDQRAEFKAANGYDKPVKATNATA